MKEVKEKTYGDYKIVITKEDGNLENIHISAAGLFGKVKDLDKTNIQGKHLDVLKKAAEDDLIPELT